MSEDTTVCDNGKVIPREGQCPYCGAMPRQLCMGGPYGERQQSSEPSSPPVPAGDSDSVET